jgi:Tetracyclin repressor-like, C-terminal domain
VLSDIGDGELAWMHVIDPAPPGTDHISHRKGGRTARADGSGVQLLDLVVDGVLAEVNTRADPAASWAEQVKTLARRLRAVLEDHPGIAGLLKTRDPLGPHSLALAEAFLAPLQQAGLPGRQTALAFSLIYDYTIGFALSDHTTVNEQRVQDAATRRRLHTFFRSLPADRFPSLAASAHGGRTQTPPPAQTCHQRPHPSQSPASSALGAAAAVWSFRTVTPR